MTAALLTSSSFRSRSVRGLVVVGKRIGRTIGFPTANLAPCDTTIAPPSGVYATTVSLEERGRVAGRHQCRRAPHRDVGRRAADQRRT